MLYQITDGSVSLGGHLVLSHVNFEIRGTERIAVVGRNGAGKTTLLRLIAGELELDRDDRRQEPGISMSRRLTIGMLGQKAFPDPERTVEEEFLRACPWKDPSDRQRFEYEWEYDRIFTGFGFKKEDKGKKLREFSGGEQTKIGLIRLLLEKPDILLLDEPTNHLDLETVQWLEEYLNRYPHAVVMVSHDRFFLDQTAQVVYEIENGQAVRYGGNYTWYREEKRRRLALWRKAYDQRRQEAERLSQVIERFKHKPTKASFARAKKKQLERLETVGKPVEDDVHLFTGEINPLILGSKWVMEAEHLKIGYDRPLLELSLRIRRGQKIGLLGPNGAGKSTFLRTAAGLIGAVAGECRLGNHVTIGYFDQHAAEIQSEKTVLAHFQALFPALTEKEARGILGAYLFRGREAFRRVSDLSGGEKARLVLAELLQSRPNFLILDEPTNHMDIPAKETLESAFRAYTGTILFVSHDRYFIRQVAQSVLIFEDGKAFYYPFGYEHYLERMKKDMAGESPAAQIRAEDQALIASLRAVPAPERHCLREFPTEEMYGDWKRRLRRQEMEAAGAAYEEARFRLEEVRERLREGELERWTVSECQEEMEAGQKEEAVAHSHEETAREDQEKVKEVEQAAIEQEIQIEPAQAASPELSRLEELCESAWKLWHEACMNWAEAAEIIQSPYEE